MTSTPSPRDITGSQCNSTNTSPGSISCWLAEHRIKSTGILPILDDLGASEVQDLLDLDEQDLAVIKNAVKKLEFTRFTRGIDLLRSKSVSGYKWSASSNEAEDQKQRSPGLLQAYPGPNPGLCREKLCNGYLTVHQGERRNPELLKMGSTVFRWVIICSCCKHKWHACHFGCGHLQKISAKGCSDIVRHELGRYNRWQTSVKRPCSMNPAKEVLEMRYYEQQRNDQALKLLTASTTSNSTTSTSTASNSSVSNGFNTAGGGTHNHSDQEEIEELERLLGKFEENGLPSTGLPQDINTDGVKSEPSGTDTSTSRSASPIVSETSSSSASNGFSPPPPLQRETETEQEEVTTGKRIRESEGDQTDVEELCKIMVKMGPANKELPLCPLERVEFEDPEFYAKLVDMDTFRVLKANFLAHAAPLNQNQRDELCRKTNAMSLHQRRQLFTSFIIQPPSAATNGQVPINPKRPCV